MSVQQQERFLKAGGYCIASELYFIIVRVWSSGFYGKNLMGAIIGFTLFTCLICLYVWFQCRASEKKLSDYYLLPWTFSWRAVLIVLVMLGLHTFLLMRPSGVLIWNQLSQEDFCNFFLPRVINSCLGSAINEEIMFRGVLFSQVKECYGTKRAVLIVSLLFGFSHLANGDFTFKMGFLTVLYSGSLAVLLSIVTIATKSIWTSVVLHSCINMVSKVIAFGDSMDHIGRSSLFTYVYENLLQSKLDDSTAMGIYIILTWIAIFAIWKTRKPHQTNDL